MKTTNPRVIILKRIELLISNAARCPSAALIENVVHRLNEEEQVWFPKIRGGLGRKILQDIGAEAIEEKEFSDTLPNILR